MDIRTLDTDPRTLLLFSWEQGTEPIKNILRKNPGVNNIIVLIDPESGFSSAEAETAKEKGSHLVSPGPNIL
ncbi:MAG: 16S rRNA (uracil(1498)-N(3))-methyltransferase, partial [Flavisolibacter sp.]